MAAIGSLRVELELNDGSFTTRVIRAGTTMRQLETQVGQTITAVRQLDSTFSRVGGGVRDFVLVLGLARAAVENVATVIGGLPATILRAAGEIERLTMLLRGLSQASTEAERIREGAEATRWITDLAQRAPFALESLTQTFVRLRAGGIDPMRGSMQALVDAVAAFGGSREQLDRAGVAIQQMAGKGVISLEELRQQLGEAVPTAIPLMARAMGVTVDELVEKIALGRVRAAPALQALTDEMARTFGGRAVAQMQTFRGQLQVLETQWTLLRVRAAGDPGSGGFLDAATKALQELNTALQTPDFQGLAIRVGQTMRDITNAIVTATKFVYENAEAFKTLGLALAGLGGFLIVKAMVSGLAVSLTALYMTAIVPTIGALTALATGAIPAAVGALSLIWRGLNAAALAMGAFSVATLTAVRSLTLFGAIRAIFVAGDLVLMAGVRAATAAVTGLSTALMAMGGPMGRFGAALAAGGIAATGFRLALLTLAGAGVVGGIVLAISLISAAIDWLSRKFTSLSRDSGAAFERLRQGAADTATILSTTEEAEQIEQRLAQLRRQRSQINDARGPDGAIRRPVPAQNLSGDGILPDLTAPRARDLAGLEAYYQALGEREGQLLEALEQRRRAIQGAQLRQREQMAGVEADSIVRAVELGTQQIRSAYDQQMSDIANARRQITQNSDLTREQRAAALVVIDEESLAAQRRLAQGLIDTYQNTLTAARALLVSANESGDQQAQETQRQVIQRLETQIEQMTQLAQRAGADLASALTLGGNDTIDRQATTRINNMRQRLAQLREEAQGNETQFARISQLLSQANWAQLPGAMREEMISLARETDQASRAVDNMRAVREALGRIDDGFSRATTDLEAYSQALSNPNMTSAQTGLLQFQRQMAAQLMAVGAAAGFMSAEFANAAVRIDGAVRAAQGASALGEVLRLAQAGEAAELRGMTPQARAAAQNARNRAAYEENRAAAVDALRAAGKTQEEIDGILRRAQRGVAAGEDGRTAAAGRAGAAQAENQLERMRGRIAELTAEIQTGTGEYAKLWATMSASERGSAAGQQILQMAQQLDALAGRAEAARAAWNALDEVVRKGATGQQAAAEYLDQLGRGGESRDIVQAQARINAALATLRSENADPAVLADRERQAQQAMAGIRSEYVARQAVQFQDQQRQISEGLANSLGERRRIALETLRIEGDQYRESVRLSALSDEQKAAALENFARFRSAREQQVLNETANGLERMMRDWGRLTDNTFDSLASGIDKLTDGLIEFATTGKANFADMAKSILADLARIQLRAAASGIFNLITGAGGAAAGGKFGGAGNSTTQNILSNFGGGSGGLKPGFHDGGIVGSEASFMRALDSSLFRNAPRYHTGGIAGDEVAAVLKKGEGVFTEGQMAAIGRMNRSYGMVEQGMAQLVRALPAAAAPRDYSAAPSGGTGSAAMPGVRVNLINESGDKLNAVADQPYMDMEGMVVDVVLRNASRPGPLRDLIRGA